jgi:uncharacterized membrane protein YkvA (DUF1232 family)
LRLGDVVVTALEAVGDWCVTRCVPRRRKVLLFALVGYLALQFDLVPDFIPVAGQLDDVIVVALVLRNPLRAGGEPVIREPWPGPERTVGIILRLAR